jgi:hypothetical protein
MQEQLAALARSTVAQLDAEDEYNRKIDAMYDNQPMTTPAVWRIHGSSN